MQNMTVDSVNISLLTTGGIIKNIMLLQVYIIILKKRRGGTRSHVAIGVV